MTRRKVLIVCMLDSIHAARWLAQFCGEELDFIIAASKKHKKIHPQLISLLKNESLASFNLAQFNFLFRFHGYLDYVLNSYAARFFSKIGRVSSLKKTLKVNDFEIVHALEMQGAGYLLNEAIESVAISQKLIVTNWGSDIYFFQENEEDKKKLRSILSKATHYSAECRRDYELARNLGFEGIELPCIPNAGGFDLTLDKLHSMPSRRLNIAAKAYGGTFGRGDLVISAVENTLKIFPSSTVHLYSVTDDLMEKANSLSSAYPDRVTISTRRDPLSTHEMKALYLKSKVYVGASRSDGISTSFLEALIYGCYPIQTNTSCAGDWLALGAIGSVVAQDTLELTAALHYAFTENVAVDKASEQNSKIANIYLDKIKIKDIALTFYC